MIIVYIMVILGLAVILFSTLNTNKRLIAKLDETLTDAFMLDLMLKAAKMREEYLLNELDKLKGNQ